MADLINSYEIDKNTIEIVSLNDSRNYMRNDSYNFRGMHKPIPSHQSSHVVLIIFASLLLIAILIILVS